jgi:hypothetical protein
MVRDTNPEGGVAGDGDDGAISSSSDDEYGGTAPAGGQGGDKIDPDTGEFVDDSGGSGAVDDDDSAEDAEDQFGSQDGYFDDEFDSSPPDQPSGSGGSTPSSGNGEDTDTDSVPDVDGERTRRTGPAFTPDDPSDRREVLDEGGESGEAVFDDGDDPFRPDASSQGVEEGRQGAFGTASESSARDQAVERLQGKIDREVPGVAAIETDEYNIRRTADGYRAVLTDRGYRDAVATQALARSERTGVVGDDGSVGRGGGTRTVNSDTRLIGDPAPRRRQPIDDAGSAEAAQDAFAASGQSVPTTDELRTDADAVRDPTLARAEAQARLEARRDRLGMGETEEFGDIDFSFGLGDPETDEVEQFVDDEIGGIQPDLGLPPDERPGGQERAVSGAAAASPTAQFAADPEALERDSAFAQGASDAVAGVTDLPGQALEGVETATYLTEATPAAGGSEEAYDERFDQVATAAEGRATAAAEFAANNPVRFGTAVAAGSLAEVGVASSVGRAAGAGRGASAVDAGRGSVEPYTPDIENAVRTGRTQARRARRLAERRPDISVVQDPDAGLVDVSPQTTTAARESAQRVLPSRPELERPSFGRPEVADRVTSTAAGVRDSLETTVDSAREAPSRVADRTDAAVTSARVDLAAAGARAQETADNVPTASDVTNRVDLAIRRGRSRARQTRTAAELSARSAGPRLSDLQPEDSLPDPDVSLPDRPTLEDTRTAIRDRRDSVELSASAAVARAAEGADQVDVGQSLRLGAARARRRGSELRTRIETAARSAASPELDGGLSPGFSLPDPPSTDLPDASGLSDLTLRVGPPRPRRRRVVDVGDGDVLDADTDFGPFADDDLDGFDTTNEVYDFGSERSAGGGGQNQAQRVTFRQRDGDAEAPTDVVGDSAPDLSRQRPELATVAGVGTAAADPVVGGLNRVDVSESSFVGETGGTEVGAGDGLSEVAGSDAASALDLGVGRDLGGDVETRLATRPRVDLRTDTRRDTGIDIRGDSRFDTRQDTELRTDAEVDVTPPRREADVSLPEPEPDDNELLGDITGDDRTSEVDFGNLL